MEKETEKFRIVRLGNWLFRFKRLSYFIPVFLLVLNAKHTIFPFNSHFYDEVFEFFSFAVALLGMTIRLWASGSSKRTFVRKNGCQLLHFEKKGIFSIMKNPHFFGDLLVIIGLSIPLFSIPLFCLSLVLYLSISVPILMGKEKLMSREFPDSSRLPLLFPSFKHWKKSSRPFHWLMAFQKEGALLIMVGALFFFIEQSRDVFVLGEFDASMIWILAMLPFVLLFIFLSVLDPQVKNFPTEMPEFPD